MKNMLSQEIKDKILNTFSELSFEELKHEYKIKERRLSSASHFIKNYTEGFDADKISYFVAKKRGITREEVLKEWDNKKNSACDKGNRVHYFGEKYMFDRELSPQDDYEKAIVAYFNSLPENIIPAFAELKMYSNSMGIAGTADIILYNLETKKFIIADWKTNEDLFKNYRNKKLLKPFNNMLDSPISKYTIQLSTYQILFEQTGFDVESREIIWLKEDGTYEIHKTPDLREEIIKDVFSL